MDASAIARKRDLIAAMDADRDRGRRAESFDQIHTINKRLADANPGLLSDALARVRQAKAGLANRGIATKRDWCFAFYDHKQIDTLSDHLRPERSR